MKYGGSDFLFIFYILSYYFPLCLCSAIMEQLPSRLFESSAYEIIKINLTSTHISIASMVSYDDDDDDDDDDDECRCGHVVNTHR